MVSRPAAVPRSKEVREGTPTQEEGKPAFLGAVVTPGSASQPLGTTNDLPASDFSEFVFSESSPDFQIEADIDPIDAEAEEAAVLYANGQDDVVRSVLENAVRIHQFGPGERLWLMLFDLYRLSGQKASFEELEIEYARSFEKSPPGWGDNSKVKPKSRDVVAGSLLFRGELTGDNTVAFDAISQALEKNPKLRLDLSKVSHLDSRGCGLLLAQLQQARKAKREIELLGRDALGALVEERVESGRAEDKECWLFMLELCQLQGQYDAFEEVAINFAITFEVSPPSWEPKRVAAPEPIPQMAPADLEGDVAVDAYVLRGDVKSSRFGDLVAHAEVHNPVLIDCSALTRMDFISAGALLNVLTAIRSKGKQVMFRHPNHLVAELFGVVGLKAVASIVFEKH